jgi:hypothetical protein
MSEEQAAPEETTSETLLDASTPELSEGEYFLSDGIKGTGDTPEWYKGDKYKSVAEQAKAYTELEKKFGGFTGAPKDGYQGPEGIEADDALLQELTEFASSANTAKRKCRYVDRVGHVAASHAQKLSKPIATSHYILAFISTLC